jgi:SAM-dependent methyltransferase
MHEVANMHQSEAWNGYEGRHWADHSDRYDAANDGANEPLFSKAAIRPGDRVLDVGCGTGKTTRLAARQARDGYAVGIDLSEPMLSRARQLAAAEEIGKIEFVRGDAQTYDLPRAHFDVAISRFGVMFFSDPVAAFTNIASALRPAGRLCFVALQDLSAGSELMTPFLALYEHLPAPGPDESTGDASPDSLADPDHTRSILEQAGCSEIEIEPIRVPMLFGANAHDAAAFLIGWGPVQHRIERAGISDTAPLIDAMYDALRPFEHAEGLVLNSDVWLVSARK